MVITQLFVYMFLNNRQEKLLRNVVDLKIKNVTSPDLEERIIAYVSLRYFK